MNKKYTEINSKVIDKWVEEGWEWGQAISHEVFEKAKNNDWYVLLTPTKPVPKEWFCEMKNAEILGLASGGGQQMPIFAALGAKCTVMDYSEKQLLKEKEVAERENYEIKLVKADMTEPFPFEDESFDLIFHPVSNCYIEDVFHVWKECYRVLKKGGILLAGLDNGINYAVDDEEKMIIRKLPYNPLKDKQLYEESIKNDWGIQFSHTIEEQIGGQLKSNEVDYMNKSKLSIEQKRADTDLNIIIAITLIVLAIYMLFGSQIISFSKNTKVPLLLRTLFIAFFQWGVAGLGITVVALYRKEGFVRFGLTKINLFKTILLSALALIPYIIFGLATGSFTSYLPFQTVIITKEWLEIGFPYNMIGLTIIAVVWGFFEGFNYVVISDKINKRYPSKSMWLNWGAITCGVACLLIHGMIGFSFYTLMEALAVFIMIYGMLVVKNYTNNAWGCILIFILFWNAFS